MARPFIFLAAFMIALFALDRVAAMGMRMLVKTSDHRLARIYGGTARADILVMGNSVGNAMTVPPRLAAALGRTVFSIACHGMDARTQNAFVGDMIEKGQAPKIAVLEVRPIFSKTLQAPAFSTFQSFSERLTSLEEESHRDGLPWTSIFRVYSFNSPQLMTIMQKIVDRDDQATGPSNGRINTAMIARWRTRRVIPEIAPDQLEAFLQTIDSLHKAGAKVIVVAGPLHPVTRSYGSWMPEIMREVRAALPRHVIVADYSDALSDDRYFEDPMHLNKAGRAAFQPYLVKLLAQTDDDAAP